MSLIRRISTVGGFTLLSRILGLARDLLMARYLGAGMAADAFFIAFKLPNFFRRLFAEGAFSVGFVPLFSKALGRDVTAESQAAAEAFASRVLAWLLPVLVVLLLIMEAAMVPVMLGLTGAFPEDGTAATEKFDLVVELGRYTFPYLLLISLVSFFAGMLNAVGRFSAAAFAPVLLNIMMIGALTLFHETNHQSARALAIAVSLSGILQLVWLYWASRKAGLHISLPRPRLSDDVRELLRIMGPAAIGAGVMQINLLADVVIAARMLPEGSVSWLFYADRLAQLPLGVIGIAVGTVLLPGISRLLAANDELGAQSQQNRALEFSLLLTLPAAAALGILAAPIIATLFEREAFLASDTTATATALVAYAAGLPAYVIQKGLNPAYFARGDTRTPVVFATASLILNLILNLILIQYFAHVGLAIATAISAWLNVGLLYGGLVRRGHFRADKQLIISCVKFLTASLVMAGLLIGTADTWQAFLGQGEFARIATLFALVIAGAGSYFSVLLVTGGLKISRIRRYLGR